MTSRTMTFCKAILLLIGLSAFATMVACSGGGHTTTPPPPTVAITATSGGGQSATVSTAFAAPLVATVTTNGTPTAGVVVTFTAPSSGASGTFASNSTATEMQTTNSSGVATSSVFTANSTVGGPYNVVASATGATSANFGLTNTAVAQVVTITATSGTPQTATVSTAFAALLVATVNTNGTPTQGVVVTFTAPGSGASGTFASNSTATEMQTTDVNGVATSSVFTANSTTGIYNVTASAPGAATSASFSLTNSAVSLAAGNYVFSLSGADSVSGVTGFYSVAGVFTVGSGGTITGGEQDFTNSAGTIARDLIGSGTVATATDGNTIVTLTTCNGVNCAAPDLNVGVSGVETIDVSLVSTSKALITEYDTSATSSGELNLQTSTSALCPAAATTPCGYAFFVTGLDSGGQQLSIGGVLAVDAAGGGISGTGSVFDLNRPGSILSKQAFAASSVSTPDVNGRVTFTLVPSSASAVPTAALIGYIIDATHMALVESNDPLSGTTGGFALGQGANTGNFSKSSVSGSSFVFGTVGQDNTPGALQVAGVLTFNSDNSVTGNVSFNDFTSQAPSGGETVCIPTAAPCITGASYTVDSTGRVTISGLTDATAYFNYNYQFYIDGNGHAEVISMDTTDVQGGIAFKQTTTALTAASISGNYAVDATQVTLTGDEQDGVGTVLADGVGTFAGFLDVNETFVPTADLAVSGTFAVPSGTPPNGLFTGTFKDPVTGTTGNFNYYFVDNTRGVAIQIDNTQLTLGTFLLEQ